MKKENNIKIVFIGKYDRNEILSGNVKVAKRIFYHYTKKESSIFIEYFFDGEKYNYLKKLFGSEVVENVNGSLVLRLGIISMLIKLCTLKPQLIHIQINERFAAFAYLYKLIKKVKFLFSIHGIHIYEDDNLRIPPKFIKIKNKIAERIFIKYSDGILVLSEICRKLIRKYYGIKDEKLYNIHNGIDLDFHKASFRKVYKVKCNLKLVFIADIERKEKGFSFLKNSLEEISYPVDLYIVDKKDTINNIHFINKKIKIYSYDKMYPRLLAEFLINKDVFISASFYEPFNISAVEAMATGIVPILTNETGASVYIKDGINGFTFDYGDKEKLKSIILFLIKNPEIIKNISHRAKEIYNLISWEKISDSYDKVYTDLLK